ncbi:hypothetical protein CMZ82_06530 [Lysobacteraceae bacterium NML93-0792]|nr:hypothetical protein CMZ82_06530 [Xanthomonadaceae bacterium NML93-0792]PBS17420.1 hypothetical protein CMZ81_01110 [Xanthomonadaceae bacterium NML93-0793]PBS20619.1 hypothetical protein CMZ80_01940 [Xanthomonadaceae bacterium NML93-0831]
MASRKNKAAEDAQTIAKLIEDIDITMFTTVGSEGYLVSRPLSTQKAQFDGEKVWFFVAGDSPKVAEIERNSKVNLAYASKGRNTYVSMAGDAYVNNDPVKIEAFWNDALKAYFPRGINDPKLTLIEVAVRTAEFWDGPGSLIGKAIAFAVARVTKRDDAMGENRIVDLRQGRATSKSPRARATAAKTPARKAASSRAPAKKATAKKPTAKKATAKKTATKRSATTSSTASKKTATRKATKAARR